MTKNIRATVRDRERGRERERARARKKKREREPVRICSLFWYVRFSC